MKTNKWGWTKATNLPERRVVILLASVPSDGSGWIYEFGCYYDEGDVFEFDGDEVMIKKPGYFTFNPRNNRLRPAKNVRYWTYVDEPGDINDEFIVLSDDL